MEGISWRFHCRHDSDTILSYIWLLWIAAVEQQWRQCCEVLTLIHCNKRIIRVRNTERNNSRAGCVWSIDANYVRTSALAHSSYKRAKPRILYKISHVINRNAQILIQNWNVPKNISRGCFVVGLYYYMIVRLGMALPVFISCVSNIFEKCSWLFFKKYFRKFSKKSFFFNCMDLFLFFFVFSGIWHFWNLTFLSKTLLMIELFSITFSYSFYIFNWTSYKFDSTFS